MSPTTFSNIVRGVFLFAYAAFLAASITHIAFFFHGFEPQGGTPTWLQEWGIPYGLAIAIDVTNVVMMIGVTFRRGAKVSGRRAGVWAFIGMLTLFSWVANWEYALEFQSSVLSRAASASIPLIRITFYQLNPILASSFAFLNLAYSLAAELFNTRSKTAEELAQEADRLESLEEAQKRIDAYHERNKKASLVKRLGVGIREVKDEAKQVFGNDQNTSQIEVDDEAKAPESEPQSFAQNKVLEDVIPEVKTEECDEQNILNEEPNSSFLDAVNTYPKIKMWLSTGQKTATIEEIVEVTGYSKRRVTNRVHDGTLKRSPRNAKLILISSVIAWLKTPPLPQQNDAILREQPTMPLGEKAG